MTTVADAICDRDRWPLSQVLMAMEVAATRAGAKKLEEWAWQQIDGYPVGSEVPEERMWPRVIKGDILNDFTKLYQANLTLPNEVLPPERRDHFLIHRCYDGIPTLERGMEGVKPGAVHMIDNPQLLVAVSQSPALTAGTVCRRVWLQYPSSEHRRVIENARAQMLRISLEAEKKGLVLTMPEEGSAGAAVTTEGKPVRPENARAILERITTQVLTSAAGKMAVEAIEVVKTIAKGGGG